jgi:hypothetical protein
MSNEDEIKFLNKKENQFFVFWSETFPKSKTKIDFPFFLNQIDLPELYNLCLKPNPKTMNAVQTLSSMLPQHVWNHIYEYDSTYKNHYTSVLSQLRWNHLIRSANYSSYRAGHMPQAEEYAYEYAMEHMATITPYMESVGFRPEDLAEGLIYINMDRGFIELTWNIREISPALNAWASEDTRRQLDQMQQEEEEMNGDSFGRNVYEYQFRFLSSTVLDTDDIKIMTATNLRRVLVVLKLDD